MSCPLPSVSSLPPVSIDSAVEEGRALRSMLWPAAGIAALVDSTSVAVPIPTLSTTVVPASLYKTTVLFEVIALVVEE